MLEDKTGQRVPSVTVRARQNDEWVDIHTDDLFKGKTVAVFSLPGAFTPTCSASHLPRYNELAQAFRDNGVDEIVCVSVNDTFVMNAWLANQKAENVTVLPDGNGEFTEGMGMLVDKGGLGFGRRSWRYSMLVKDGVIEKMFIEPEQDGDPFEVSDADTMLNHINPDAQKPHSVAIFTKPGCVFCAKAKTLLKDKGYEFEEIILGSGATSSGMKAITGRSTMPQIFIDGKHIGGHEELEKHLAA